MTQRQERHDAYSRWLADEIQAAIDDPSLTYGREESIGRTRHCEEPD
ncbi:MAG: hypothetical protein LBF50_10830 [Azoarcus sp.]|jgi:hypothetical protein|nr:hypothetical protein [Azoarcus sp.]